MPRVRGFHETCLQVLRTREASNSVVLVCHLVKTSHAHVQDPTNNPKWTGKEVTEFSEESAASKFIRKYGEAYGGGDIRNKKEEQGK